MKYFSMKGWAWATLAVLAGCTPSTKKEELQVPNLSAELLNTEVSPGDDFNAYANTHWKKANPIPDDKSRYGKFDALEEDNKERLKTIFEEVTQADNQPGSIAQKISDFYKSGMDTASIEKEGLQNISFLLDKISAIKTIDDIVPVVAFLHSYQIYPFFAMYSSADPKNSNMTIADIYQTGLGLPDRDYYFQDDEASKEIQDAYRAYIAKILAFSGVDEVNAELYSTQIFELEYAMAKLFYSRTENRDPFLTYNKIKGNELEANYPGFDWKSYFSGLGVERPQELNVNQVKYLKKLGVILKNNSPETISNYLKVLTIRSLSPYLSSSFVNARFEFYGKVIQGTQSMEARWKKVQTATNGALGEGIGQLFVQKFFPEKAKKRMEVLVANLRLGFKQRIEQSEWMSEDTKVAAIEKLNAIHVKIGYPSKWRDYSKLEIKPDSYVQNVLASNRFDFAYDMDKIGKPVDKDEWHMFPQTVNAYYNPSVNEIVFPAAILQPPFFYMDGDDAVNYGAIGVVIGHEMTHGFDDQGSKYDKDGNLNSWWSPKDSANFATRTKVLAEQFNQFPVKDTLFANGEFTLGENIADLGGLNISYAAYLNAIKDKEVPMIGGLNDKERFFLSYANIWAQNIREKEMIRRTKTDPHSLGKYRVNGPLPNIQAFYDAFDIDEQAKMFIPKDERAIIW
ncbi:M13 family metallopeptidase [Saccharicrinis fermentans]|uniref:Neutral endopeptidase n=1 Tax=Saccharicrinis fermentans DSM 9555 = JCM 21142 TaxID=869213 RepID=W7XYF6_9BACT|nr:M13 family metallopeptidase [Saccharicrinis fermentans]GAF03635.1 neutral endopeptidase [Saccharicrinis fermentans DSM 9555 = JCM 21142]